MNINDVPQRYRKRIQIDPETGCWLWMGCKSKRGYVYIGFFGRNFLCHRFIFELLIGSVPQGFELHHKCKIRHCVNPDHLDVVTRLQHKTQHHITHCKKGHELTPENTFTWKHVRKCRICKSEARHRTYLKNREKILKKSRVYDRVRYRANPEKFKAYQRNHYWSNVEQHRAKAREYQRRKRCQN